MKKYQGSISRMFAFGAASVCLMGAVGEADAFEYDEDLIDHDAQHIPTALGDSGWVGSHVDPHGGFFWDAIAQNLTSAFTGSPSYKDMTISGINTSRTYVAILPGSANLGYTGTLPVLGGAPAAPTALSAPVGCGGPIPMDVSDNDVVVGYAYCSGGVKKAFVTSGGAAVALPTTTYTSVATDVSPSGSWATVWDGNNPGGYAYNPHPNYYSSGGAVGMHSYGVNSSTDAFRYDVSQQVLEPLTSSISGLPAGAQVKATTALGVNDDGGVVGYVSYTTTGSAPFHELPVIWASPQVGWVLPDPASAAHDGCRATSINSDWQVVGTCYTAQQVNGGGVAAFMWDFTHGSRDLTALTDSPTEHYTEATHINDYGQIAVAVYNPNSVVGGYHDPGVALLTPKTMSRSNCNIGGVCHDMYANQCAAHGGDFGIAYTCTADPHPGELSRFRTP